MSSNALSVVRDNDTANELIQLVSFSLDGQEYGVEVLKVREIIRMTTITSMPNTGADVEGIINLRGRVIPIISLRKRFSLMEAENSSRTRIIVMDMAGELTGFVVDAVSEVIRVSGREIQPPPTVASGGVDQDCISGVVNHSDRLLVLVDLDRMLPQDERGMLEIEA